MAGRHPVLEALRAGRPVHKIWLAQGTKRHALQSLLEEASRQGVPVQETDRKKLDKMTGGTLHQGVAAECAPYHYTELEALVELALSSDRPPFLLLLDEIEDPHNLGSIIRTADCAGVHGIIIPKRRAALVTSTVVKTSAGAVEHMPIARVTNLNQTIQWLKQQGLWIAGMDVTAPATIYESDLALPLALVIGNEGKGISRLVKQNCDMLWKLPMLGNIQSLNASAAAAIVMYEVLRQRNQ